MGLANGCLAGTTGSLKSQSGVHLDISLALVIRVFVQEDLFPLIFLGGERGSHEEASRSTSFSGCQIARRNDFHEPGIVRLDMARPIICYIKQAQATPVLSIIYGASPQSLELQKTKISQL